MAKRIASETEVVVSIGSQGMQIRGTVEAARRIPGTDEWNYLVSTKSLYGQDSASWHHESTVEVDGQTSLKSF